MTGLPGPVGLSFGLFQIVFAWRRRRFFVLQANRSPGQ
jgi:hypothetical protein